MFVRPLVTFAFDADPTDVLELAIALAPEARTIDVALRIPVPSGTALGNADLRDLEAKLAEAERRIELVRKKLADQGFGVDAESMPGTSADALVAFAARCHSDVVVFGRFGSVPPDVVAGYALEGARKLGIPCVAGRAGRGTIARVVCPFDGRPTSLARVVPFLRDRCDEHHSVTLFSFGPLDSRLSTDLSAVSTITGVRARIELVPLTEALRRTTEHVASGVAAAAPDLIVVSTDVASGFAPEIVRAMILRSLPGEARPVLFVPPEPEAPDRKEGALDAFDFVAFGPAVIRVERAAVLSAPTPFPDGPIDLVVGGARVACVEARAGSLVVPESIEGAIGLGRAAAHRDPIEALEAVVEIVRAPRGRLALFDSRIAGSSLVRLRETLGRDDRTLVAVRLVVEESASSIRARLRNAGFARPLVIDVRDLLDEGGAADVPLDVAAVRLCRAAARMRTRGGGVDAVVASDPGRARASGFAVFRADVPEDADLRSRDAYVEPFAGSPSIELDVLTGSRVVEGNRIAIVLENDDARTRLVDLVDSARQRVHAQWYIVADDEVGREIEAAFRRASERGVVVRVLVDSLYSMHESFGAKNPLLERLAAVPGIEVRASSPIVGLPTLSDLKRRDHRKLLTTDGTRGVVTGRNLGNEYYRSFSEVRITRESDWRQVPWLDAGAHLEGPVVRELDNSFAEAWVGAGGAPIAALPVAPSGDTAVRFVVHRGLSDAYTLEAYLALIERAKERLVVVNGFPLQLEVQHAMLRAIARGVKLSLLVGHVRPKHGADQVFAGGAYRSIVDTLVLARVDALVAAGADVRELVVREVPGWDPALGAVRPYVHAKVICADRRAVAIGSANLDVTAGYWESEALVVLDDPEIGADLDARLERWLASAVPFDPNDPTWRDRAEGRAWLGRIWPSVIG